MWDGSSLTEGKPNPLAFARTVVTTKTAAQRSSRVPDASAPATTRPATMPTRLNTVWRRVYVVMLRPRIIGAPFAGRGLMYAGWLYAPAAGIALSQTVRNPYRCRLTASDESQV